MTVDFEALINCNHVAGQASELARLFLSKQNLLQNGIVVPTVEFVDTEQTRHAISVSDPKASFATFVISYNPENIDDQVAQVHPSVLENSVQEFGEPTVDNYIKAAIQETLLIIAAITLEDNDTILEQLSRHVISKLIN